MEKEIKDYISFYIGAKAKMPGSIVVISHALLADEYAMKHWGIRPILRPLSNMTEKEAIEYAQLYCKNTIPKGCIVIIKKHDSAPIHLTIESGGSALSLFPGSQSGDKPEATCYLLSKHFDLFGLIESGLAIDKTKVTPLNEQKT